MIALFRTNQVSAFILLVLYVLLLHLPALSHFALPPDAQYAEGILYQSLFFWAKDMPLFAAIAACILVSVQALLVNWICNETRVAPERNWIPSAMYVFCASCLIDFQYVTPPLVAVTFVLLAARKIYHTYKSGDVTAVIFDTGFWIAVGGLFYPPAIWLAVAAYIGINGLRVFKIREQVVFVVGAFVPGFLAWTWSFWQDKGGIFQKKHVSDLFQWCNFSFEFSTPALLKIALLLFILLIIIVSSGGYYNKKLMQTRKYINALLWLFFVSAIAALFINEPSNAHFLLVAPAAGIFLGMTFQSIRSSLLAELLHLLLLGLAAATLVVV